LKPQKEATIAASEDNDDLPPHLKERREKLSAKSESLMIRMKELKQRQNAIRSRVASLHNEDNDDD
jgi:chaperonin cofactor prefoldin